MIPLIIPIAAFLIGCAAGIVMGWELHVNAIMNDPEIREAVRKIMIAKGRPVA
jgi:hypothetical protein